MKKLLFIVSLSVVLVLALAGCGSADTSTTDPVTVLQNYLKALNAGDIDKAMSFVADDAVFIDPMAKHTGKERIRAVYEVQMNNGGLWEAIDIVDTNGKGRLVYDFKAYINGTPVYVGTGLTIVREGKIIFDGTEFFWKGECDRDASQSFCVD